MTIPKGFKYIVEGGVYQNTTFTTLAGPKEFYGPFNTYEEARKAWWEGTSRNVDICEHRLFIIPAHSCFYP